MNGFAQAWGALFYTASKLLFLGAELAPDKRRERVWRIWCWSCYMTGSPAWIFILFQERNWIALSSEAAGGVAMALGLTVALRGLGNEPPWLDNFVRWTVAAGIAASLYDKGGLTEATQLMEVGLVTGFLVGTYLLAKERYSGYLWYLLMNASCAFLMDAQGYAWLAAQQVFSFVIVLAAYLIARRKKRSGISEPRSS